MRLRESAILAPDGRKVLVAESTAFRTAGTGRRFAGFYAPDLGPNAALLPHLSVLRARSRALYRNHPLIWGAIEKLVANLVGWGLTPKSQHPSKTVQETIDLTWFDWAKQVKFDAIQKRAARECMLAGEVFLRIRPRRLEDTDVLGRRLVVPLDVQLIEAEHCPETEERMIAGGGSVRAGIEFDAIGRRRAYWMYRQHPGDGAMFHRAGETELVRVPASEVIHLFDPESPEAIRGTPRLARTALRAHDLDAFDDATLQRQAVAALFAGFIKRPDTGAMGESDANPEPTLEPATLSYLGLGEDIVFPNPPDVGSNYPDFVKHNQLVLSAGIGVTYEMLSNDLSEVNYSSIRAGSLEFRRACQVWQYTTFCAEFLEPIWVHFLRRAQLSRVFSIPGFDQNEIAASRCEWISQGWDWVDPEKEVNALHKSVQAGFDTRTGVNIARGNDPRRIERDRADEQARAEQLGLQFTTDVPEPGPTSDATPKEETREEDDDEPRQAQGGRRAY